jgi:DNA-binding FadR family transcriptional regulator
MKLENYYLDLDKVSTLKTEDERQNIHSYYRDMMYAVVEQRPDQAKSIMNTLLKAGFLKNLTQEEREEKIETILG